MSKYDDVQFSDLVGKTLTSVEVSDDKEEITWKTSDGEAYLMFHQQECCESVSVEDISGDLDDLIGTPVLMAEESTNDEGPNKESDESATWTFYRVSTIKGTVVIRWYGTSNGYYSERVDFDNMKGWAE